MRTRLLLAAAPVALLGLTVGASSAASPTGTYTATAPVPAGYAACDAALMSAQVDEVVLPGAGTFTVEMTGFQGDWDLAVESAGSVLGESVGAQPLDDAVEKVVVKVRRRPPCRSWPATSPAARRPR